MGSLQLGIGRRSPPTDGRLAAEGVKGQVEEIVRVLLYPSPVGFVHGATRWDAAELLDLQMDQVAGMGMLVTADRPAGGAIQPPSRLQL